MNNKIILIVAVLLIAIGIVYFFFPLKQTYAAPCFYNADSGFALCSLDKKQNEMVSYAYIDDLTNFTIGRPVLFDSSLLPTLNAGDYVEYFLNFSKVELPSSYYVCIHGVLLTNLSRDADFLALRDADSTVNNDFACTSQPLTTLSNKVIRISGTIPCMNDNVSLIEFYVIQNNFIVTSINQFEDNVSSSNMVFGVYGEIKC